jgi:alpha-1,2-mannosyltransferase
MIAPLRPLALVMLLTAAILTAIVAFTATAGLLDSMVAAAVAAVASALSVARWLRRHPALGPDLAAVPRGVAILSTLGALALVVQLVRLSVFIVDPTQVAWSTAPWNAWLAHHSCVSAYWAAGREVHTLPNVWGEGLYTLPRADPAASPVYRKLGPLFVDGYEYPPTFLLLPRAIALVAPDFFAFRKVWFALNLAVMVIGLVAIARRLGGAVGTSASCLAPLVVVPLAITTTLQVGNVQMACIATAMLAMLCFEARPDGAGQLRAAAGGLLLASVTVSKLYPGMLIVYLLARREWRAVAWTTAWGAVLALGGLIDLGWAPHAAFLVHLPRLLSGEAFPALVNPRGISGNMSVPGIVFKLGLYGVAGLSFGAARIVGWAYTVLVIGATVHVGRRPVDRAYEPLAWLAILMIATLRSPLLPPYGVFPALWIATIVLAAWWPRPLHRRAVLLLWLVLIPVTGAQTLLAPRVHAVVTFAQTLAALALVVVALRLGREPAKAAM